MDETYNKSVKISDYFSDTEKFIKSVSILKRQVGFDLLDAKKRFRLKKCFSSSTVSKAAADLMAYCDNPFREKKFFCSIL
uniref:G protein gamma domain-containing protein n=1 Tax=Labrus bergylta TaxID=56723 RepID=A0A3Q3F9L3_9LABR